MAKAGPFHDVRNRAGEQRGVLGFSIEAPPPEIVNNCLVPQDAQAAVANVHCATEGDAEWLAREGTKLVLLCEGREPVSIIPLHRPQREGTTVMFRGIVWDAQPADAGRKGE